MGSDGALVAPTSAEEAQQKEKEVDEVQVEFERTDDGEAMVIVFGRYILCHPGQ
jgi:hypothetical protein